MGLDQWLAVLNSLLALSMAVVNFILFWRTRKFFRWVRLMYTFDGLMMFAIQALATGTVPIDVTLGRGGATLVLTTILCSALLTLLGGSNRDYTDRADR